MKPRYSRCLFFTLLLFVMVAGCRSNQPASTSISSWTSNTNRLLQMSAKEDGSYAYVSGSILGEPDLHSTYYALKIRQHLDITLTDEERNSLQDWLYGLLQDGRFVSDEKFGDTIGELYYGISIMTMADIEIVQRQQIAERINALQLPDGSYAFHKSNVEYYAPGAIPFDSLLLTVAQAVMVLRSVDAPILRQENLLAWLHAGWDRNWRQSPPELWKIQLLLEIYNYLDPANPRITASELEPVKERLQAYQAPDYAYSDLILLELNSAHRLALQFFIEPEEWRPEELLQQLVSNQNLDGGYDLFLSKNSEWVGTEAASGLFRYFNTSFDKSAMINLLLRYQDQKTSGYFQIVSVNSGIDSTWGALQVADSLGLTLPNSIEKSQEYVRGVWNSAVEPIELHYALLSADLLSFSLTNSNKQREFLFAALSNVKVDNREDLDRLFYTVMVLQRLGARFPAELIQQISVELNRHYVPGVGYLFDGSADIMLTAKILLIFHHLGQAAPLEAVSWLKSQYRQEGYYTATEYPLLTETYMAVLALSTLELEMPQDKDVVTRWIQTHFVPSGGAIPTLAWSDADDGTLFMAAVALKTIEILNKNSD
jgi:hypothetical protein